MYKYVSYYIRKNIPSAQFYVTSTVQSHAAIPLSSFHLTRFCEERKTYCKVLSLQVWRTEVNYWKVDEPKLFASDSFPVVMYADKEHELCYYSLPIEEYPGLFKV